MQEQFTNPYYLRWIAKYREAKPVESVTADALSERTFRRQFVDTSTPCVIQRAAADWPALERWRDARHLTIAAGESKVQVRQSTLMEGDLTLTSPQKEEEKRRLGILPNGGRGAFYRHDGYPHALAPTLEMTLAEFIERTSPDKPFDLDELFFLYSEPLDRPNLSALLQDLGKFSFLPTLRRSLTNWYGFTYALFMYRNHITDWHYHVTSEALLTQISGTKEVLLLPPDQETWATLAGVQRQRVYAFDAPGDSFPGYASIVPIRAVLEPGDSLFIPNYWWHLVATASPTLGQSVTTWFHSPAHVQCDLRRPAARQTIKMAISMLPRRQLAWVGPAVAAGVAWWALRHAAVNRRNPTHGLAQ